MGRHAGGRERLVITLLDLNFVLLRLGSLHRQDLIVLLVVLLAINALLRASIINKHLSNGDSIAHVIDIALLITNLGRLWLLDLHMVKFFWRLFVLSQMIITTVDVLILLPIPLALGRFVTITARTLLPTLDLPLIGSKRSIICQFGTRWMLVSLRNQHGLGLLPISSWLLL